MIKYWGDKGRNVMKEDKIIKEIIIRKYQQREDIAALDIH